jgi:hypothetical protein
VADEYLSTDPNAGAVATAPEQPNYLSTDPNAGISSDPALAGIRANYSKELSDPNVAGKLYSLTHQEVGTQGPAAQQAFVETVFNRAAARGMTLAQTVSDPNYYPAVSLRPTALSQDHIDHYEGLAANAVQGSNISNYATGNASGTVGFDGGPQTFKAGGERFGIEGHDLGWAQNFDQMQQGAPVQRVDTYTRVEKAVPVQEVEHQVARAYPVNGPRPPLPKGPDTLNAPPQATPGGYLSTDPDAGLTPPALAAPEGDFPLAKALVPPQFTNFMPQQVAPTQSGKLPEQPPPDILASPEAYAQSVSTGQDFTPAEMERANKLWQTRLVNLPKVKEGDISASGQKLSSFDAATVNMARGFASGLTSMEGLFGLIPPVGLAEMLTNAPHLIDAVHAAEQTPAWSQDRWEAGLNVITSLVGAGLLGKATIEAGIAGIPKAEAKPGTSMAPAAAAAPAGEAGAAPAGEAAAGPAPPGEAGATAATPPRTWANVAEELRWLAKNDPAQFKVRFAEEMAKRQNGEYDVKTDTEPVSGVPPKPPPTQPTAAAPGPAPETPAPAAAAPTAEAPTAPAPAPAAPVTTGPVAVPEAITEELAARGMKPAQIAALSAGQAANLVLQPALDEIAAGTAATTAPAPVAAGVSPAAPAAPSKADAVDNLGIMEQEQMLQRESASVRAQVGVIAQRNGISHTDAYVQYLRDKEAPAAAAPSIDLSQLPDQEPPTPAATTPEPTTATATQTSDNPIYPNVPLSQITLSKDVPQFKSGADENGIVEPLAGKPERAGMAPVQLWRRLNGQLELISGRHRFDLFQRSGEKTIPAQIYNEADGFDKRRAARLDAELNIRDNQGSIADYANYFRNSGITQEAAQARGLLARGAGKAGFAIARGGGESLFALHQSGRLTDAQAQAIAEAAPGNEGFQRVGIQNALAGRSGQSISNLLRAFKAGSDAEPELEQPELLSAGDPAMKRMAKAAERAGKVQREIGQRVIAIEGAARHPGKAKVEGVDVGNPAAVVAKAKELKALQERARNWDKDDQLRPMILHGDMTPDEIIKALSPAAAGPPADAGTEDLFNVAEEPAPYGEPAKQWYHGTPAGKFAKFKGSGGGIYFTSNPDLAHAYTQHRGLWVSKSETPAVPAATLDLKNPLVIDAMGTRHDNIPVPWQEWKPKVFGNLPKNAVSIRDAAKYAKDHGHDGLIVRNVIDTLDPESRVKSDVSVVFSPEQIKPTAPDVRETPAPYGEGNPVPAANTVKLAEDIQTFLDFNKVPPAKKPQATEEIKNTLAKTGDPALQKFYQYGFGGILKSTIGKALRANKGRISIIYHDLISRQLPVWNIEGSIIANAADLAAAVGPIRSPYFESFKVVARDPLTKRVVGTEITGIGTLDEAIVHPRDVMRMVQKYPGAEFIVSHNHPSGIPRPSSQDQNTTTRLRESFAAAGAKLVDHVITNGKQYFSFEKEEVTGDGYGTLPNPVLQPWEVVRPEESPTINTQRELEKFTASLRADDPNAVHIFYTNTQGGLTALERVSQGTSLDALRKAIAKGIGRESPYGVLVDFAKPPPPHVLTNLVNMVHDAMLVKFLDASWPGMDSARATGALRPLAGGYSVAEDPYGGTSDIQRGESGVGAGAAGEAGAGGLPRLAPLSEMESSALQTLRRAKGSLTAAGKRKLARLEARVITQGTDLLGGQNAVFNLHGEEVIDWAARQAQADAAEAVRVAAQQAAEKAQMTLFEKPSMPYVTGTARVNESTGGGAPPYGPQGASMFSGNTPPRSNPMPIWARRYANKMRAWWQDMLPRSSEIVRKVPESPVISQHQLLMERELSYVQNFTKQPWWQALRRRTEEEIVDLEHAAVTTYRRLLAQGAPREAAWAQAVSQAPPDLQALFQHREGRVPTERWAAGQLAVDEPAYTGDPYIARLTNEEGKAVVDLHPQIPNWSRHIRQSIGSFEKSRVHATMKEGIQAGVQYEPPTLAAFTRELYSTRLEGTARMLQNLKDKGVLFDDKAAAIAANRTLKNAGPVTLVRGFGGKDYWARSRVEAQFLAQNLNTTNSAGAVGKLVRIANAFTRNPNLLYNPLPHVTKNMAFKYALARVGNYGLFKAAREFGTNAEMRARFEAVMPMPATGARLPQLRALEAGSYLERMLGKAGKILSGNHFSARFNFAKADPAMRYALWKSYVKKGLSDQAAANHVWVDLIRYDENSGALNFWRGIPFNFFGTWRLGTYISLAKQLRSHPIRALLFIGAVEYLREILYRKYGWWTHLPVDYVDAPLASAIQNPRTIPGVAATTLIFGPGGGQAPSTIQDVMKTLHGDPGQWERAVNMFWGLSQLYNIPQAFNAYMKDKDPQHLALILSSAAFSTHSALKYNPHRLMQWMPEWMPGLEKSAIVRQAEALQAKIQATQEKARTTYEARHGISQSLEYETPEGQMQALRRAAGVHPPPPGPPRRTRVLPNPRRSGRPRGF